MCTPSLKIDPHTRKYCPADTPAGTVSAVKVNSPAVGSSYRSKKLCVYLHSSGTVMQSHPLAGQTVSAGVMVWTEMPSRYSANRVTPVMAKLSDTAVV